MNNAVPQASAFLEDHSFKNDDERDHRLGAGVHPACTDELAHELRQPLSTIESLAYFLEMTTPDDRVCRHLEQIRLMVTRANRILDHASTA
ncbi:MAG: hypothetical protein JO210_00410 [Acidobacteriaceae bacterium]|nr:hypothetical protein [Acidobacteriaceae bacterium]